jgi:serine/threonine/tyrosine protein kinase RAD53
LGRDLKPENILLTADNPPKAKVADFGLAKLVDEGTFLKVS